MYCPVCRGEFQEGYTYCKKCNVELVDDLPPVEERDNGKKPVILEELKLIVFDVEKLLKYGGLALIIIGILMEVFKARYDVLNGFIREPMNTTQIVFSFMNLLHQILTSFMWGLFYIALGHIIHLLKEKSHYENE